jgi:fido (protein-threonine AMPylation protein)
LNVRQQTRAFLASPRLLIISLAPPFEQVIVKTKAKSTTNNPEDKLRRFLESALRLPWTELTSRRLAVLHNEEFIATARTPVVSKSEVCETGTDENAGFSDPGHRKGGRQAAPVAKAARYAGESSGGAPEGDPEPRGRVDGVRERTGEYGSPQGAPEEPEKNAERLGSTRYFETAEGTLSYTQVSERLAVALVGILEEITQTPPEHITITSEWLCLRHRTLAGSLFPDWAGRYRDVNIQVGSHTPLPSYEVPGLVRLFCDDLAERLRHVRHRESSILGIAELLAWADWRFQWIHPFKDFNGRIGRILLAALLYKLALPNVETAPLEPDARRRYLEALRAADGGDLGPLTELWVHRIAQAL